ncbi:long-chain-fatty-acid--CoA ligase [Desulfoplanes formicivorans]|uniref:Long-chain fatty acid--CoA ligase n=1 Tax=Desulfoplanes formicivorans TaxID=1592317 RepID=A0A194AES7_9BACT|nr:long-chain fatty acid--CoA ligase [Desulfoplanes formicivorans]GAU07695.1 long-chain fatty acid--CoA ligase [Desulfoplanes formicivorans]
MIEDGLQRYWLKSYDREVSPRLSYENIPIHEYLDRSAKKFPKRKAIVFNNWSITYAGLRKASEQIAANLREHGVRAGDRVAIMLPNTPQAIMSFYGVLKAGCIAVMTNPLYMEKELVHHFSDSGAKVLITLDLSWPKLQSLEKKLNLSKIFVTRISDCLRFPLNLLYNFKAKKDNAPTIPYDMQTIFPWKRLLKKGATFSPRSFRPEKDLALLQYTGGTTGVSKGVMITHQNLAANVQQYLAILHKLGKDHEVLLGILPYFHIFGLNVCVNFAVALGATMVPFPRFVPRDILKSIKKIHPTIFPCAPSVFMALLQQKDIDKFDLSSIRFCISGSAPIPAEIIKQFKKLAGAEIIEGYGLTEASPVTHLNPLNGTHKLGSIGLPISDTDACIVDMEVGSLTLQPGQIGELVIRGPQVMKGYWNRPDETASTLRNNWLYTGDIAYMDEDGYFFIVDRKKDLIISGGYNIYPREIDEVLHEHPKIREAVAVGIPHHTRGEIIKAYVVVQPGETLTRAEVISFCRQKLANYKIPKKIEFRKELPKTLVGKVLRRALRDEEIARLEAASKKKARK